MNNNKKRIRHYLFLDHYFPNMTAEERVREDKHIGESVLNRQ
jgi:hypothetical protein